MSWKCVKIFMDIISTKTSEPVQWGERMQKKSKNCRIEHHAAEDLHKCNLWKSCCSSMGVREDTKKPHSVDTDLWVKMGSLSWDREGLNSIFPLKTWSKASYWWQLNFSRLFPASQICRQNEGLGYSTKWKKWGIRLFRKIKKIEAKCSRGNSKWYFTWIVVLENHMNCHCAKNCCWKTQRQYKFSLCSE